jgi:hypothetical protein
MAMFPASRYESFVNPNVQPRGLEDGPIKLCSSEYIFIENLLPLAKFKYKNSTWVYMIVSQVPMSGIALARKIQSS